MADEITTQSTTTPPAPSPSDAPVLGADPSPKPPAAEPLLGTDPTPKPADPTPSAAPEKYEFKAPDGVQLNPAAIEAVTPVLKKYGITQEAAQALLDTQVKLASEALATQNKQVEDEIAAENVKWYQAARSDKEFGGAQFEANAKVANAALGAFGNDELRKLLKETGYANHPEFLRFFWKVGQRLGESTPPNPSPPANGKGVSGPALSYPSMVN